MNQVAILVVRVTLPVAHGLRTPNDQVTFPLVITPPLEADIKFNSGANGSTRVTSSPVAKLVLLYPIVHTTIHPIILVDRLTDLVIARLN